MAAGSSQVTAVPYNWPYDGSFNSNTTALVIIDMQEDFCSPQGYLQKQGYDISNIQAIIPQLRQLLQSFRSANFPVFHTREGHRPDLSTLWPREAYRSKNNESGLGIGDVGPLGRLLVRGEAGWDIVPELSPAANEPVIDKPGKDAFMYTDFELLLRVRGIKNLVIAGVTTEVCISSTMRQAAERGFDCLLVTDGTAASNSSLQACSIEAVKVEGGIMGSTASIKDVLSLLESLSLPKGATAVAAKENADLQSALPADQSNISGSSQNANASSTSQQLPSAVETKGPEPAKDTETAGNLDQGKVTATTIPQSDNQASTSTVARPQIDVGDASNAEDISQAVSSNESVAKVSLNATEPAATVTGESPAVTSRQGPNDSTFDASNSAILLAAPPATSLESSASEKRQAENTILIEPPNPQPEAGANSSNKEEPGVSVVETVEPTTTSTENPSPDHGSAEVATDHDASFVVPQGGVFEEYNEFKAAQIARIEAAGGSTDGKTPVAPIMSTDGGVAVTPEMPAAQPSDMYSAFKSAIADKGEASAQEANTDSTAHVESSSPAKSTSVMTVIELEQSQGSITADQNDNSAGLSSKRDTESLNTALRENPEETRTIPSETVVANVSQLPQSSAAENSSSTIAPDVSMGHGVSSSNEFSATGAIDAASSQEKDQNPDSLWASTPISKPPIDASGDSATQITSGNAARSEAPSTKPNIQPAIAPDSSSMSIGAGQSATLPGAALMTTTGQPPASSTDDESSTVTQPASSSQAVQNRDASASWQRGDTNNPTPSSVLPQAMAAEDYGAFKTAITQQSQQTEDTVSSTADAITASNPAEEIKAGPAQTTVDSGISVALASAPVPPPSLDTHTDTVLADTATAATVNYEAAVSKQDVALAGSQDPGNSQGVSGVAANTSLTNPAQAVTATQTPYLSTTNDQSLQSSDGPALSAGPTASAAGDSIKSGSASATQDPEATKSSVDEDAYSNKTTATPGPGLLMTGKDQDVLHSASVASAQSAAAPSKDSSADTSDVAVEVVDQKATDSAQVASTVLPQTVEASSTTEPSVPNLISTTRNMNDSSTSQLAATESTLAPMPPSQDQSTFGSIKGTSQTSAQESGTSVSVPSGSSQPIAQEPTLAPMPPAQDHSMFGLSTDTNQGSVQGSGTSVPDMSNSSQLGVLGAISALVPPAQDLSGFGLSAADNSQTNGRDSGNSASAKSSLAILPPAQDHSLFGSSTQGTSQPDNAQSAASASDTAAQSQPIVVESVSVLMPPTQDHSDYGSEIQGMTQVDTSESVASASASPLTIMGQRQNAAVESVSASMPPAQDQTTFGTSVSEMSQANTSSSELLDPVKGAASQPAETDSTLATMPLAQDVSAFGNMATSSNEIDARSTVDPIQAMATSYEGSSATLTQGTFLSGSSENAVDRPSAISTAGISKPATTQSTLAPLPPAQDLSAFGQITPSADFFGASFTDVGSQSSATAAIAPPMPVAQDHSSFGLSAGNTTQSSVSFATMTLQSSTTEPVLPPMPPAQDQSTFGMATQTAWVAQAGGYSVDSSTQLAESLNSFVVVDQMPGTSPSSPVESIPDLSNASVNSISSVGVAEPTFTAPVTQDFAVTPTEELEVSLGDILGGTGVPYMKPGCCEKCGSEG